MKAFRAAALMVLFGFMLGCATIFSKSSDEIKIDSEPSGAKVYLDGEYIGTTPMTHKLDRETFKNPALTFRKEGYETHDIHIGKALNKTSLWNLAFICTTFGATSWGIDALSGALIEYSPKSYIVELEKKKSSKKDEARLDLRYVVANYERLLSDVARHGGEHLHQVYLMRPVTLQTYTDFLAVVRIHQEELLKQPDGVALYRALERI